MLTVLRVVAVGQPPPSLQLAVAACQLHQQRRLHQQRSPMQCLTKPSAAWRRSSPT